MIKISNHKARQAKTQQIQSVCNELASTIETKKNKITELLLKYESHETAMDEIMRSLDCLKNIDVETDDLTSGVVNSICTFFPVNLPLYSLVIFAVIPGFMSEKIFVRPPILMNDVVQKIYKILKLDKLMPGLVFVDMERNLFREAYIAAADVVLFTGRYVNAKNVQEACPDALFVYNGAGINPVVVTASAPLELAVHKTIEMRTFNSGQDCAGSDAILVHAEIFDAFLKDLLQQLKKVKVGSYADHEVKVGPLIKKDQLSVIESFFNQHKDHLVYGGKIDYEKGIVYPTVIVEKIKDIPAIKYTEFFAPVFYLLKYHNDSELSVYFDNEEYLDHAMCVSIFDEPNQPKKIKNSIILANKIVNDVERGNYGYGGYGPKANFASYHGVYHYRPMLISKEISNYLKYKANRPKI